MRRASVLQDDEHIYDIHDGLSYGVDTVIEIEVMLKIEDQGGSSFVPVHSLDMYHEIADFMQQRESKAEVSQEIELSVEVFQQKEMMADHFQAIEL